MALSKMILGIRLLAELKIFFYKGGTDGITNRVGLAGIPRSRLYKNSVEKGQGLEEGLVELKMRF